MNVQHFLRKRAVPYEVIAHNSTYSAQRMSHAVHVSGYHVAKTVLLKTPKGCFAVAVLPAAETLDMNLASSALGVSGAELATEDELASKCPECELGVLPPFGSQYEMKTIVDAKLAEDEEILFEGNNHNESIKISFADYVALENPKILPICSR